MESIICPAPENSRIVVGQAHKRKDTKKKHYNSGYLIISIILFIFSHFDLPFILLICGTLVVMAGQNAFTSKHEIYTKYYVPTIIYKNSGQVILIGKTKTVISDSLLLYTSNNLYICKDEIYNEVNRRLNDMWYVCEK